MEFSEFVIKVQGWQTAKGIYEHSTPLAQALKAVSEVGELADAVIKGNTAGIKDGIGDVMVCLVGVATMRTLDRDGYFVMSVNPSKVGEEFIEYVSKFTAVQESVAVAAALVGGVAAVNTLEFKPEDLDEALRLSVAILARAANLAGLTIEDCCEAAWLEIKDRKGFLSKNGAFIKQE